MGLVLGWTWFVIGYILMQTSVNVWVALMLPQPVARARRRIEHRPLASFFTGLLLTALFLVPGIRLMQIPQGFFLGFIALAPLFAGAVIGGAAWTGMVADRIQPLLKSESRFVALVAGALGTTFATLLPVVGWFLFLPVLGLMGTGAGFLGWVSKKDVAAQPVSAAPPAALWPEQPAYAGAAGYTPAPAHPSAAAIPAATPGAPAAWTAQPGIER